MRNDISRKSDIHKNKLYLIGEHNGSRNLPKNLREINEEQFKELFYLLREKTKNFTEITRQLLTENPQYMFFFRILIRKSQFELSKLIGVDRQWVRHFESGRQGFKQSRTIPSFLDVLNNTLNNGIEISLEKSVEFLKENQKIRETNFYQFQNPEKKFKRIFEMTDKDLEETLIYLKKETNNFTKFNHKIIERNPELFSTFRVILNTNIEKFSKLVQTTSRNIRRWESFIDRITPHYSKLIMKNTERLFKKRNLYGNVDLDRVKKNFERFTFFEKDELEIQKLLLENGIQFEQHVNVQTLKKKLNVDFIIPSKTNPRIVIEVSRTNDKKYGDTERRLSYIDHRFQLIKLFNPKIITVMFIRSNTHKLVTIKNIIEQEIVNTDFSIVNDTSELVKIVQKLLREG